MMKKIRVGVFLAYKNLVFSKKSFLLISSIIGLTYLSGIFIGAVIYGLQVMIEDKAINTLTGNIAVFPEDGEEFIYDVSAIEKKLKSVPGVVEVSPRYIVPAVVIDKYGNKAGVNLVVVDPEKEKRLGIIDDSIVEGKFISKGTKTGFVIGGALTEKYKIFESIERVDVRAGDKVKVIVGGKELESKILGIYSVKLGGAELYGFVNRDQALKMMGLSNGDVATHIIIKTSSKGREEEIVRKIKLLGIRGDIRTWQDQLGTISQFTDSLMITNKIALIVSIMVTFGIIYIMVYINAFQKRSQLGILKAIGIDEGTLIMSYTFQSLFYVLSGIFIGLSLAYISYHYFSYNPIKMPFGDVVPIFERGVMLSSSLFLILSGMFAGYFASKNVIKKKILEMIFSG